MLFDDLDLAPDLRRGIEDAGFVECTPIQAKVLPWALDGEDVAGQAQTGTGKTATFLLSAFTRLIEDDRKARPNRPRAIVIAPTRELALQIADDATVLGRHTGLRMQTIYGGVGYDAQRRSLQQGVDMIIGTPGRIIDYLKRREIILSDCQVVVIDEADRMFDMGFLPDLRFILKRTPSNPHPQMMLFSATLNFTVMELAYQFMNNPQEFAIEPEQVVVENINEVLYHVGKHEKFSLLLGLLNRDQPNRVLIFCNRKHTCEKVSRRLNGNDWNASYINGDLPQNKRQETVERYKKGDLTILVATDVASRGLHVDDVSHVYNYDLPQDPDDYVHRIGRTARMGATGHAITLACEDFVLTLPAVESYIGHKIPQGHLTNEIFAEDKSPPPPRRDRRDGRGGGRGGRSGGGGGGGGRSGGGGGGGRSGGGGGGGRSGGSGGSGGGGGGGRSGGGGGAGRRGGRNRGRR
jgi:ATP-dependent RNA helicase RhlB